jgi:hypothetical protein
MPRGLLEATEKAAKRNNIALRDWWREAAREKLAREGSGIRKTTLKMMTAHDAALRKLAK